MGHDLDHHTAGEVREEGCAILDLSQLRRVAEGVGQLQRRLALHRQAGRHAYVSAWAKEGSSSGAGGADGGGCL